MISTRLLLKQDHSFPSPSRIELVFERCCDADATFVGPGVRSGQPVSPLSNWRGCRAHSRRRIACLNAIKQS